MMITVEGGPLDGLLEINEKKIMRLEGYEGRMGFTEGGENYIQTATPRIDGAPIFRHDPRTEHDLARH